MATAGTQALTVAEAAIFLDTKGGASEVTITADTATVLIHVDGLHADDEFMPLPNGTPVSFKILHNGIRHISGKTASGAANVTFGVTERRTTYT